MLASPATPTKRADGHSLSGTPHKTPRKGSSPRGDRYVAERLHAADLEHASYRLTNNSSTGGGASLCSNPALAQYVQSLLADEGQAILSPSLVPASPSGKILSFKEKPPGPPSAYRNGLRVLHAREQVSVAAAATRFIDSAPERTLDAPMLLDDYYLNLLSWSSRNVLAVALGQRVYLWNPVTAAIEQLMETRSDDQYVSSIAFVGDGSHIAVGTSEADVQIWDVSRLRQVRTLRGHSARVGSLAWNGNVLSSGARDAKIFHHDVRMAEPRIATLEHHRQEVCGLQWSPDGTQLASGGNDNLCCVWDGVSTAPRFAFEAHQAAVKALAWSPHQPSLLASGGGTADRTIRFWNTSTGACLNCIDTKSQVCALQWSKLRNEVVSSHGFSQFQLTVWKYPTMSKIAELTAHTARVLHLAQSPDGTTIVSGASDETLRFWRISPPERKAGTPNKLGRKDAPMSCLSSAGNDLIR